MNFPSSLLYNYEPIFITGHRFVDKHHMVRGQKLYGS